VTVSRLKLAPKCQWRFKSANLPGATASTLTLTNVQSSAGGKYQLVVTNNYGSSTSAVATLTVKVPPKLPVKKKTAYNQALSATNGAASYTFAVTVGSLAAGLILGGVNK
jgi:hypothetical protein